MLTIRNFISTTMAVVEILLIDGGIIGVASNDRTFDGGEYPFTDSGRTIDGGRM